ncbi:MAG: hypothetical protein KJP26_02230, partial [Maribacter sp.]|nr:hypothetical protein [Maribacter sp.]
MRRLQMNALFITMLSLPILQGCEAQKKGISVYSGEIVKTWNEKVIDFAIAEDNLFTLKGVRTTSMMHVAMHDALNAIAPKYTSYAYNGNLPGANPIAAVAQAAYEVAVNEFPDRKNELDQELGKWLS